MGVKPFESVFEQLPVLVDEWKKKLDAEFAKLVKNPLSTQAVAPSYATPIEPSTDNLRLACAVFNLFITVAFYPEMFTPKPLSLGGSSEHATSTWNKCGDKFVEEAPYIVLACGLDPSVTTIRC